MSTLTYNDVLSAYREYPAPIRPYLLRAATHPFILGLLSKSLLRVLVDLLGRAPIDHPGKPILVKVANVAEQLDVSEKTVSRAIKLMRAQGWIEPEPGYDGRNWRGRFATGRYLVSPLLRTLVGLPTEPRAQKPADPVENPSSETKMSAGVYGVNEGSSKKEASFRKEGQTPSIPVSLAPLHEELGISLAGICALMRSAKLAKQRLQDVWTVKRDQLRNAGAKGGRAKAYLEFLLGTGEDFAYRARCAVPAPGAPANDLAAIAQRCRYKLYQHVSNGMRVRFFDGTAEVTRDGQSALYAGGQMQGLYKGIAAGNLREVVQ